MRWLYHALPRKDAIVALAKTDPFAPGSLDLEGFVHASYRDVARASAELYVPDDPVVLRLDPRRIPCRIDEADTPRGPMPHVHGSIPRDAIVELVELAALTDSPDYVTGTRFAFVAFEGMTLLDLVGALDPVSRIAGMGFDATSSCEVVAGTLGTHVWEGCGAWLGASRVRPSLGEFDVVVVPGGPGAKLLTRDTALLRWLATFPPNRLAASVCTGSLLWAAEGRLKKKRATTHASAMDALENFGAFAQRGARVVADEAVLTAAGVTASLDLGLELVARFTDVATRQAIARQMEMPEA